MLVSGIRDYCQNTVDDLIDHYNQRKTQLKPSKLIKKTTYGSFFFYYAIIGKKVVSANKYYSPNFSHIYPKTIIAY